MMKKGLSPVIATVLLILVTIAGVSLISSFIIPFVKDSLKSTDCLQFRDYFSFEEDFGYNCYDSDGRHGVSIKKSSGDSGSENIVGLDLVLKGDTTSIKVNVRNGDVVSCLAEGIYMLGEPCSSLIDVPGIGNYSAITYIYNSSKGNYKKAEVYPVIKGGKICEMSDSIKLNPCKPEINLTT